MLETQAQPTTFALGQNFPNPFNASTTIPYERTQDGPLSLAIYDVLGRRVRKLLANGHASAGAHRATWDGRDQNGRAAASGLYFYRLQTTQHSQTRRMMLIR